MKSVIYVWKNNSIHRSKLCDDFFQLIQTTCYLHYLSVIMSFTLYVDTQHHSISKVLPVLNHPHMKLISDNEIPVVHDLDYYIQSTDSDILYFCSTTSLPFKLNKPCIEFIQRILMPSPTLILRILPIQVYNVVHVHINNPIISKFKYPYLLYTVYERIKHYLTPTTIVLSDTYEIKTYIKSKHDCIVFDTKIGNIGYPPHDNTVEDTLFDLYLMSKATKIYSFSWYNSIPGFVKIANVYNVPIVEIKLIN
jgi:hypothetical protein